MWGIGPPQKTISEDVWSGNLCFKSKRSFQKRVGMWAADHFGSPEEVVGDNQKWNRPLAQITAGGSGEGKTFFRVFGWHLKPHRQYRFSLIILQGLFKSSRLSPYGTLQDPLFTSLSLRALRHSDYPTVRPQIAKKCTSIWMSFSGFGGKLEWWHRDVESIGYCWRIFT